MESFFHGLTTALVIGSTAGVLVWGGLELRRVLNKWDK